MRKYREYSDEQVINYAKEVVSIAQMLRKLGLQVSGGNYAHMRKTLQRLNINCSHWTGQGWNKNKQLKDWSKYSRAVHLKKHLINVRGHQCEECKLTEWLCQSIPLEVHHLDGDRTNNEITNLKLTCCNCHAQTENWRNKKRNLVA